MRILFLINELEDVSFDRQVLELVSAMPQSDRQYYVYSLRLGGVLQAPFHKRLGRRFYVSKGTLISDIMTIAHLVRREHIDVIQTPAVRSDTMAIIVRLLLFPRPLVHIAVRHNFVFTEKTFYHFVKNIFYVLSCHLVDLNICVASHIQKSTHEQLFVPMKKVQVIQNGVLVKRNETAARRIRLRLHLVKNRPVILFAGAFIDRKNPLVLIQALRHLHTKNYCIFLGTGPLAYDMRRAIQNLGLEHATFIEEHRDIAGYLSLADIVVLPSRSEGLPLVVLEAMHAGIPCVVSDIPAHRELIQNRQNGLVAPSGFPEPLAQAIQTVLASSLLRRQIGRKAKETATKFYGFSRMIRTYETLYDGLRDRKETMPV